MVIYLDTETTGLYPGQICQLSYVMQGDKKTIGKNFFFSVESIDVGAYMVHKLTVPLLKRLSSGKVFADFIDEIEKDFLSADYLVAHNSSFDFMFLRREFERAGKEFVYKNGFCSMKKSVSVCKILRRGGGYKYPKLNELTDYFGISDLTVKEKADLLFGVSESYHDARFDITATYLAVNSGIEKGYYGELKEFIE